MTGIYAIINTPEPVRVPYGPACPAPLAAITHRSYVGKAKDFERRWRDDHVQYLLNGRHACTPLLDAFHDWLRSDVSRLELLAQSKNTFKSMWLVRAAEGPRPEWKLGPFVFRVLEEVPLKCLPTGRGLTIPRTREVTVGAPMMVVVGRNGMGSDVQPSGAWRRAMSVLVRLGYPSPNRRMEPTRDRS